MSKLKEALATNPNILGIPVLGKYRFCESGSKLSDISVFIPVFRIRIDFGRLDPNPDPYPGGQKCPTKVKKSSRNFMF